MDEQNPERRFEREASHMEQQSDRVGDEIDEARSDWEAKEQDASVPGAQPEDGGPEAGHETDEDAQQEAGQ